MIGDIKIIIDRFLAKRKKNKLDFKNDIKKFIKENTCINHKYMTTMQFSLGSSIVECGKCGRKKHRK